MTAIAAVLPRRLPFDPEGTYRVRSAEGCKVSARLAGWMFTGTAFVLVLLDAEDRHHVCRLSPDGEVEVVTGPVDVTATLDAAYVFLAGRGPRGSVTGFTRDLATVLVAADLESHRASAPGGVSAGRQEE